jgi:hypothetical protein
MWADELAESNACMLACGQSSCSPASRGLVAPRLGSRAARAPWGQGPHCQWCSHAKAEARQGASLALAQAARPPQLPATLLQARTNPKP